MKNLIEKVKEMHKLLQADYDHAIIENNESLAEKALRDMDKLNKACRNFNTNKTAKNLEKIRKLVA